MTKKLALPVAKAGKPIPVKVVNDSPSEAKVSTNTDYEARERKYRAQSDARALAEAEEIRRDKSRMKEVKSHVKMMNKACE